jgi:hypothetical protein
MTVSLDDRRQKLAELMNESRARQGLKWNQVAERGGISVAMLRRIRRRGDTPLTLDSKAAIERGLGWPEGSIDTILSGNELEPRRPKAQVPRPSTEEIRGMSVAELGAVATRIELAEGYTAALAWVDETSTFLGPGARNAPRPVTVLKTESHSP